MESAGSSVMFAGKKLKVREVDSFDFAQVKLAFFAAGAAVSRSFAGKAAGRLHGDRPVRRLDGGLALVPEANAQRLAGLAQPRVLSAHARRRWPWRRAGAAQGPDIERVHVTAALAVSAQGREAVRTGPANRRTAQRPPLEPRFFDRQVAFNLLAQVGAADEQGHTHWSAGWSASCACCWGCLN
jgi:aspartate-semialdehyde dehydrogenase